MTAIRNNIENIIGFEKSTESEDFDGRVNVILGEKSHIFPLDVYRSIFPNITQDDFKIVKEAGHWVHVDQPKSVIVNIVKFLDLIDDRKKE
jgi:pimeloyl-ACP methyl ester carboxylesterase